MAQRQWNGSRRPSAPPVPPTTLSELTRRYHATAIALAKTLGLPMSEQFLHDYREQIACCYIEAGRSGVRLSGDVKLPPLTAPSAPTLPVASSAPVEPTQVSTPVITPVAPPPAATNGHMPPAEQVSMAQVEALFDLALTHAAEDKEVLGTRLRRAMGMTEDVKINKKFIAAHLRLDAYTTVFEYYRRLEAQLAKSQKESPRADDSPTPATPQPTAAPAGEDTPAVPQPATPEPPSVGASSSAPELSPAPEDTVDSLVAYALSLGLQEDVTRRIIKLHRDLGKCRKIFTEAAARNRLQVA